MSSSHKCIHLFFTLKNSFKSFMNNKWLSLYYFSPFIACAYLSKYQWQRYQTKKKHNSGERLSPWNMSLFTSTSPRSSPLDVSVNCHCSILFSKKFLTLSAIPNNSMHLLIQLCGTKLYNHQAKDNLGRLFLNSFNQ